MRHCWKLALGFLLAGMASAHAEAFLAWYSVAPGDADASEKEAMLGSMFRPVSLRPLELVRLTQPFRTEKASDGELPAGTLLYQTRRFDRVFFCSKQGMRPFDSGDLPEVVLRNSLPFSLFAGGMPRATSPQCFRDADGDGRFEENSINAILPIGSFPSDADLRDTRTIAPLAYEMGVPDAEVPVMELGLQGYVRNERAGRFRINLCLKLEPKDSEAPCLRDHEVDVESKSLPAKIEFFGGEVTINAVIKDGEQWRVRYAVSKPVSEAIVSFTTIGSSRARVQYRMVYWSPELAQPPPARRRR